MPLEIEVKILEIDVEETIRKIENFGGVKTYEGEVTTTYYDSPKQKLKERGCVLRLRQKEGSTEITLKQKPLPESISSIAGYLNNVVSSTCKVMNEVETTVQDFKTMDLILRTLGFEHYNKLTKRRTSYSIGDVHFDIDRYSEIPPFIEVEAKTGDLVQLWVERLGYTMNDAKPWTTSEVFKHYGKKC